MHAQLVAAGDGVLGAGLGVWPNTAVLMVRKLGDTRHALKASEETSQLVMTPTASFTTSALQTKEAKLVNAALARQGAQHWPQWCAGCSGKSTSLPRESVKLSLKMQPQLLLKRQRALSG